MPILPLAGGRFHPDITDEFAAGEILKQGEHVRKRALLQQPDDPVPPGPGMNDPVSVQIAFQDFSLCHLRYPMPVQIEVRLAGRFHASLTSRPGREEHGAKLNRSLMPHILSGEWLDRQTSFD